MNLKEPFVITISREIGSGGHTVGSILARKLNTRYCDKDLIKALEKKFNLTMEEIEKYKGQKKNWLSDILQFVAPIPTAKTLGVDLMYLREYGNEFTTEDIYAAETEILKELAQEGSCVIAGRSGFFVFKNHPNRLNVFITASEPSRIARVMAKQNLDRDAAAELVGRIDKARENYIHRFAGVSRYDARNYDLVISSDGHTEEQIADLILSYIDCR